MTPEAQRIAIAVALPWQQINYCPGKVWFPIDGIMHELDPLNDLNAMHEAEKVLTRDQQRQFSHQLLLIFERTSNEGCRSWDYAHATAAQRSQAFLKTLNLWKEQSDNQQKRTDENKK